MLRGFTHALKGINGQYELLRVVGFLGGLAYIVCANGFVGYEVFYVGREFDITAYCLAFPGGLMMIAGGTAGGVAWKDKGVANAKTVERTNSEPAKPPEPAPANKRELETETLVDEEADL